MKKYLGLITSLLLSACSGVREEGPCEIVYAKNISPYHIVKDGETVKSIASIYHMKEQDFIDINNLRVPYNLVVGQRVLVHPKSQDHGTKPEEEITVKPLDSSTEVSTLENSSIPEGMELNSDGTLVPKGLGDGSTAELASPATANGSMADGLKKSVAPNSKYQWPLDGKIIQKFDGNANKGINILAPKKTPIKAVADGIVKYAGSDVEGYGKMLVVKHTDGYTSTYAHLDNFIVQKNAAVSAGQKIGTVGNTGLSPNSPTQLHLQIRTPNLTPVDPALKLSEH